MKLLKTTSFLLFFVICVQIKAQTAVKSFRIGQDYQGGVIAYINSDGKSGIIIQKANMPKLYNWIEAKSVCNNLVEQGYDDWYLPSIDELALMKENKRVLNISGYTFWSSTENKSNSNLANSYNFSYGPNFSADINSMVHVRAIRKF